MSEMVERATKAVRENSDFCRMVEGAGASDSRVNRTAESVVRTVIKEMRRPTKEMIKAGGSGRCPDNGNISGYAEEIAVDVYAANSKDVWEDMVDAALGKEIT